MYVYEVVGSQHFSDDIGTYFSYGIRVRQRHRNVWLIVANLTDISCSNDFVLTLAEKCTRFQLDPVHLMDVIMDEIE